MRKALRLAMVVGAFASAMVFGAGEAHAACHAFMSSPNPSSVDEGAKVTVTVSRDAALADSSVRISTVNGSAVGGSDFTSLNQMVNFTGNQTSKNVSVQTTNDAAMEGAETFKLHLSDAGGCAPNQNYSLGADKTVTIKSSDQVIVQPTAAPTAAPTAEPDPTATPTPSPSPSPSPSGSPSPTPTFTPTPSITPFPDEGGLSGLAIAGIILGAGVLGSGGVILYLRRRAGGA